MHPGLIKTILLRMLLFRIAEGNNSKGLQILPDMDDFPHFIHNSLIRCYSQHDAAQALSFNFQQDILCADGHISMLARIGVRRPFFL